MMLSNLWTTTDPQLCSTHMQTQPLTKLDGMLVWMGQGADNAGSPDAHRSADGKR